VTTGSFEGSSTWFSEASSTFLSFSTAGSSGALGGESSCKLQGGDGGAVETAGCLVVVVVVVIVSGCLGLRSSVVAFG
jgi:hypothetical protein